MRHFYLLFFLIGCDGGSAIDTAHAQPKSIVRSPPAKTKKKPIKPRPKRVTQKDVGLFDEFDDKLTLHPPSWLKNAASLSIGAPGHTAFSYVDGTAVGLSAEATIELANFDGDDEDGDGIPNQIDILLGAKKADLNNAAYGSPYRVLEFPGGDVPKEEGVCTDVIVRALRNAGIDLQKELNVDIKKSRKSFPMVKTPDPSIDQRRVKTMLPYFKRQWVSLPTEFTGHETTWLPGDIVFMQTMGDKRPDHVGIVSDRVGESGAPVIINNWTDGYSTDELDLVGWVPITHRFRWKSKTKLPKEWRGLSGVLKQANLQLPANAKQAIVVTSGSSDATRGELRLLEKYSKGWAPILGPFEVSLGSKGMTRGVDILPNQISPEKREGDLTSPWGVFAIGTAFGTKPKEESWTWPYRKAATGDVWVDDPQSVDYNTWQTDNTWQTVRGDWNSAENLTQYDRALVIEHNTNFPRPGFGSAIFLHSWKDVTQPTLGCTALPLKKLDRVMGLLTDRKKPVFVQAPVWWL